ncbi:MAG: hypothetical protein JWO47_268 [Candidatus Saccharibacteria bacterium]|nr:hypothetical protein [Candidatus Saccharibacteria bacterium]
MGKIGNTLKKRHAIPLWLIGGAAIGALIAANNGDTHEAGVSLHNKIATAAPVVGSVVGGGVNFGEGLVGGDSGTLPSIRISNGNTSETTQVTLANGKEAPTPYKGEGWIEFLEGSYGKTSEQAHACYGSVILPHNIVLHEVPTLDPCA